MRILLAVLLFLPATAGAAETCPWMNAATAGGVLGVPVAVTISHDTAIREDAACSFTAKQGAVTRELQIVVQTMDTPRSEYTAHAAACGSNASPLKAIGNEAVICDPDEDKDKKLSAQVIGRVRTRIFTVMVSTTDTSTAPGAVREKARFVAEQVAGFLF